jgi:hypothetical protein
MLLRILSNRLDFVDNHVAGYGDPLAFMFHKRHGTLLITGQGKSHSLAPLYHIGLSMTCVTNITAKPWRLTYIDCTRPEFY